MPCTAYLQALREEGIAEDIAVSSFAIPHATSPGASIAESVAHLVLHNERVRPVHNRSSAYRIGISRIKPSHSRQTGFSYFVPGASAPIRTLISLQSGLHAAYTDIRNGPAIASSTLDL